eukprot:COSAG02_NODE_23981_length_702_cov_0.713101_2_plen_103_part_01
MHAMPSDVCAKRAPPVCALLSMTFSLYDTPLPEPHKSPLAMFGVPTTTSPNCVSGMLRPFRLTRQDEVGDDGSAKRWRTIANVLSHVADINPTKTELRPTNMH